MKKFLIIYIGRCGSTYLHSLLDSHPMISCKGELLHPGSQYNKRRVPMVYNPELFDDPDNYPSSPEKVFQDIAKKNSAEFYGFKLSIMHFLGNVNVMERWIQESEAICIHIKRNNLFDLYVSMKLAQKNNAWTSKDGEYSNYNIELDLKDFYGYVKQWEFYDKEMTRIAKNSNGLTISYEALNEHTQYICEILTKQLGLDDNKHIFTSDYEKQNNKSLSEIMSMIYE